MSLKNIDIDEYFDAGIGDNLLENLYTPCLKNSTIYNRVSGYFSTKSLSAVASGMANFINNEGKYRLIFSKNIQSIEDYESIKNGYTNQFEEDFSNDIKKLELMLKDRPRKIIGWMIANNFLEIKIAFKKPDDGGFLHSKWGNFEDSNGNKIYYNGSINESENSWTRQIESANVFCSWLNKFDKKRVDRSFQVFDDYWNNRAPKVHVIDFPQVHKDQFIINNDIKNLSDFKNESALYDQDLLSILSSNKNSVDEKISDFKPYQYQQEAIDSLINNNFKGIFALATGLGKTFTSLFSIKEYAKTVDNRYFCAIVCPSESLIYQWADEVKKIIGIEPLILKDEKNWKLSLDQAVLDLNNEFEDNIICLVTYQSFYKEGFISNVKKCETAKAIICDEVHNAGAPTWQKGLIEDFDCRIALSATPKRYFDDEGSNLIDSYFNGIVIERDLKWGIENNFLSPYNYHISMVDLDEDELIEYREITSKMMKHYDKDKQFQSKPFMIKANERAKIIKTASSKYLAFEDLIKKLDYDLNGGFIFCGSTPFLNNIQSIMKKNDIKYRIFIADSKTEDRKDIIKRFKVHRLDAIVAIDCLDEGIDIPTAETAIILSSSSNSKQYIQRRGRVLRKPNKSSNKIANIYDFICIPPIDDSSTFKMEQSMIKKQLERLNDFSQISLNHSENKQLINELKADWRIE